METLESLLKRFAEEISSLSLTRYFHPRLGDLADPRAVVIPPVSPSASAKLPLDRSLILHVTITGRCNARCAGCINVSLTCEGRQDALRLFEADPQREALGLLALAKRFPRQKVVVAFYGGEPFLEPAKLEAICRFLRRSEEGPRFRFMVYTNGTLIHRVLEKHPDLLSQLWLVSFSVDGRKEQHERFRRGTNLDRIHANMALLRRNAPHTKVLLWSTLREKQSLRDCVEEFVTLYEKGWVDYFFYHFAETDAPFEDFSRYLRRYEEDFAFLLQLYIDYLKEGRIFPLIHLNELLAYILTGYRRGHTACGAELATNFDLVGGKILACADLPPSLALGEITSQGEVRLHTQDLSPLAAYREYLPCRECGIEPYCGGRCPVQALTGSVERTLQYCQLLRLHVGMVLERLGEIKALLSRHHLSPSQLYLEAGYLARYTDVIP